MSAAIPHGTHFGPTSMDVGGVERPDDGSAHGAATQGDGVDLKGSGCGLCPWLAAHGVFPLLGGQSAASDTSPAPGTAIRRKHAVDLGRADGGKPIGLLGA